MVTKVDMKIGPRSPRHLPLLPPRRAGDHQIRRRLGHQHDVLARHDGRAVEPHLHIGQRRNYSLTKAMAAEYAHQGVRVNEIAPGAIRTERTDRKWGAGASGERRWPMSSTATASPNVTVLDRRVRGHCEHRGIPGLSRIAHDHRRGHPRGRRTLCLSIGGTSEPAGPSPLASPLQAGARIRRRLPRCPRPGGCPTASP
jgi:hypothetical protein